jgi:hypothetical protein
MQPYFLPYIGYFQLISEVDTFVVYDNIKYTKKGWINRNRLLLNGMDSVFSLPLASASDFLDIRDRAVSSDFDRAKLLNQFKGAYAKAPEFRNVFPWLSDLVNHGENNLFEYLFQAILGVRSLLELQTEVVRSSTIDVDPALSGKDRVLATCRALGATVYVNPIGGLDLYDRVEFRNHRLDLRFLRSGPVQYSQFGGDFVPSLSIVDVLMFNPIPAVQKHVRQSYEVL